MSSPGTDRADQFVEGVCVATFLVLGAMLLAGAGGLGGWIHMEYLGEPAASVGVVEALFTGVGVIVTVVVGFFLAIMFLGYLVTGFPVHVMEVFGRE